MIPVNNSSTSSAPVPTAPIDDQPDFLYSAESSFGKLLQLYKINIAGIKSCFSTLECNDQSLVYETVCQCAGSPATSDLQWGEHHVFDDMNVFYSAKFEAVKLKYQRLTDAQRDLVHENIYRLAGEPVTTYSGSEWGRLCAMNNLPRLADAMAENKRLTMESIGRVEVNYQIDSSLDKALQRFKSHPVYWQLFQKKVFSTENEFRDYHMQSILEGTCKSQVTELKKICAANPTWNRRQLLIAVKTEEVLYNQIIMFTKCKIGEVISSGVNKAAENRKLQSMVGCLQIAEPHRELIDGSACSPNDGFAAYHIIYDEFMSELNSHKKDNNFHGLVSIKNIAKSTSAGVVYVNHAIFFQHLKKESVFRIYDISTGFNEYFTQDEFLDKLQKVICDKYVKTADPKTSVNFTVDSKELTYPCKSALGHLYQLAMQENDLNKNKAAFSLLTPDEQCTIYGLVYQYAGEPATSDLQWGEHHVFDNGEIFRAAVTNAIIERYQQSSAKKKVRIESHVARLDDNYQNHIPLDEWGRYYAKKNLPRLADATEAAR